MKDLLLRLREAEEDLALTPGEWMQFENYFIGALSLVVSEQAWTEALRTARICFEANVRAASSKPKN